MSKLRQVTAWKPGRYRGIDFTLEDIKQYVEGTNKAIAAGIPVPLLKRHATIGANDSDTVAAANLDGAGWIKRLEVTNDGHIAWEAEDVPDEVKEGVEQGHLKFTSPEFRKSYSSEKEGVYTGPIIRHFAFTPLPGNPHQGKITDPADPQMNDQVAAIAMSEELKGISKARQAEMGCFQFDEDDLSSAVVPDPKASTKKKPGSEDADEDEAHDINNDMGKGSKDGSIELDGTNTEDEEYSTEDESKGKKRKTVSTEEVSAHAEADYHHALLSMGYKKHKSGEYHHPSGHIVTPTHMGGIVHTYPGGDELHVTAGKLESHLDKHGEQMGRQHAEKPIPKEANDNEEPDNPKELVEGTDIVAESAPPESGTEAQNPDMPPKATDKSKTAAILAGLKRKGVVLPSDWCMEKEGAADLLLTGLNTAIEAENQAEMEEEDDDNEEESPPQDSAMPYQEASPEEDSEQFAQLGEIGGGTRYKVVRRSAKAPKAGGGKYRQAVHVRVYDTTHPKYNGKGSHGLVKEWANVDSRYGGPKSAHGQALHEAHSHAAKLNALHEGATGQFQEEDQQFSETELAALPPKARAAIEAGQKALAVERKARQEAEAAKAVAFAEERKAKNEAAKDKAKDVISRAKIPPSLRMNLLGSFDTVQFSEGKEQALYTATQVAEMVAKSIPSHLQFGEDDADDAVAPKAGKVVGKDPITGQPLTGEATEEQFFEEGEIPTGHVSANRAEELVAANPALRGFNRDMPRPGGVPVSIPELVAAENARVPNNVRRW